MDRPRELLPQGPRRSRRGIVAAIAGGGGAVLLAIAAGRASGQSGSGGGSGDDDEDDGGSGRGHGGGEERDDAEEAAQPAVPLPAGAAVVEIFDDDGFTPPTLTVDPGQSIAFVNRHGDDHTATGSAFDTGIIPEGGGVAVVVLDEPGTYPFACRIHPEMVGSIGVRDADGRVPPPAPAATPAPDAVAVRIVGFAFEPPTLAVQPGTTVAWGNEDSSPHTASALDGAFDSGILDPGGAFSFTFDEAGTFPYRCNVHPSMLGEIVVSGDAAPTTGDAAPSGPADTVPAADDAATPAPAPAAATAPGTDQDAAAGIWAVALDPIPGATLAPHQGLLALRPDGTLEATFAPAAPADGASRLGPGFGSWRATSGGDWVLSIAGLLIDRDGGLAGRLAVGGTATPTPDGNAFSGSFVFEARSATAEPAATGDGTWSGERV